MFEAGLAQSVWWWAIGPTSGVRCAAGTIDIPLFHSVQLALGPPSFQSKKAPSPEVKRTGCEAVKKGWSIHSLHRTSSWHGAKLNKRTCKCNNLWRSVRTVSVTPGTASNCVERLHSACVREDMSTCMRDLATDVWLWKWNMSFRFQRIPKYNCEGT
jgi:hypothetical protein